MKVLYVTSECVPFIKTGGLADVAGSLPIELNRQGADVRVVLPKYRCIDWYWRERMTHVTDFPVLFGFGSLYCGVETLVDNGVTYYFIDNEEMFSVDAIYGDGMQEGYRFAFFCRAVAEMLRHMDFAPDVLHLNDWQTGLIAAMARTQYAGDARFGAMRIVFSIHNLRYQGIFDWPLMNARLGFDERLFTPDYLEFYGNLSCMKAGLVFADHINTVSPTYAREIRTAYFGERLDGLLRARGEAVSGILNGIDRTIYDPATDRFLGAHFSLDDMAGKATQKRYLQQEMHLSERPEVPVIAMISRLTPQKGLDLVERVLTDILRMDVQLVLLGDGDRRFVDLLNWAAWRYPGQVGTYIGLNEGLAHRIYAGSDMFLMPSQFEPCGLSQMIALRYGSVPVVRETGGLCDSVVPYNQYTDEGTGFSFANYNAHEMLFTLERAVRYYYEDRPMWARLVRRGMEQDFGWAPSARQYLALYRLLCGLPPEEAAKPEPAAAEPPEPAQPEPQAGVQPAAAAPEAGQPAEPAPAAKKPAAKKPAAKKPAAKQPAGEKTAEKKPAAKQPAEKKPSAKKPAAKGPGGTRA